MKCYQIAEKMEPAQISDFENQPFQYVVILSTKEWKEKAVEHGMGIDLETDPGRITSTRVEVHFDYMAGWLNILNREDIPGSNFKFAFILDQKGVAFIDDSGKAEEIVGGLCGAKKLNEACLERFMYEFLEQIIKKDPQLLERYDRTLDALEDRILDGDTENALSQIGKIRNELRDLKIQYLQLLDFCQEFEENENHYFKTKNAQYFHLVGQRVQRLFDILTTLVDYTIQLRDFCQSKNDEKQNKTIALLTIISTIFMPLTLIVGWYGMNFRYMPELNTVWGYPAVIIVSILIVVLCVIFFKKNKWL